MREAMLRVVRVAAQAHQDSDRLLVSAISEARAHGATWGQIGQALGMTGKAARSRYERPSEPRGPGGTLGASG